MAFTLERELRDLLNQAETEIRTFLNGYPKEASTRKGITQVLEMLGRQVFEASRLYQSWDHRKVSGPLNFSFFPGYVDKDGNRITPVIPFNGKDIYRDIHFSHPPVENEDENVSLLAIGHFYLLFDPPKFEHPNLEKQTTNMFIGGTHEWVASTNDEILLQNQFPLDILAFYKDKSNSRNAQKANRTWLNIPFNVEDSSAEKIKNWCESTVAFLGRYHPKIKWPFDFFHNEVYDTTDKGKVILVIRAFLVAFWMKLIFDPNPMALIDNPQSPWWTFLKNLDISVFEQGSNSWSEREKIHHAYNMKQFKDVVSRVTKLRKTFIAYKDQIDANQTYGYWYTIPFRKMPNFVLDDSTGQIVIKDPTRVGSAMILTNYPLGNTFFSIVGPWIENKIYGLLKDFETAREIYAERDEGWKGVLRQLRHNLLTYLRTSSMMKDPEKFTLYSKDMFEMVRLTTYLESDDILAEYIKSLAPEKEKLNLYDDIIQAITEPILHSIVESPETWPIRKSILNALRKNHKTIIQAELPASPVMVETIGYLARIIFKDILTNALKNIDTRNPRVTIRFIRSSESELNILVDNSKKISDEYLKIYNDTADILPKTPAHMGIYIIKRYSRHLGWKISCEWIELEEGGEGTRISVLMPTN